MVLRNFSYSVKRFSLSTIRDYAQLYLLLTREFAVIRCERARCWIERGQEVRRNRERVDPLDLLARHSADGEECQL